MIPRVLVDTSVWIDHLKNKNTYLLELVNLHRSNQLVICGHDLVYSELLLGGLDEQGRVYQLFKKIPSIKTATLDEFEVFVHNNKGMIPGIGVIDVHLLISCITTGGKIVTYDKALEKAARALNIYYL
jgi:predicted nucleic acid-binding protein